MSEISILPEYLFTKKKYASVEYTSEQSPLAMLDLSRLSGGDIWMHTVNQDNTRNTLKKIVLAFPKMPPSISKIYNTVVSGLAAYGFEFYYLCPITQTLKLQTSLENLQPSWTIGTEDQINTQLNNNRTYNPDFFILDDFNAQQLYTTCIEHKEFIYSSSIDIMVYNPLQIGVRRQQVKRLIYNSDAPLNIIKTWLTQYPSATQLY